MRKIFKILVCIKQVPFIDPFLRLNSQHAWIQTQNVTWQMSKYDEYAVEQALRLKSDIPGCRVDVITVGPERSSQVLIRALGMGADHGIQIRHPLNYLSANRTARFIADKVLNKQYDLIVTGAVSEDLGQGLVGPMIAEILGWSFISSATSVNPANAHWFQVERETEHGRQLVSFEAPAVVSVQSNVQKPRYPSLSNMLRAKKQELEIYTAESSDEYPEIRLRNSQRNRNLKLLSGSLNETVLELHHLLRQRALMKV